MSAADSWLRSRPTPDQIEFWNDFIHRHLYENSYFLKLMNTDHPDSRRTASEINALNQQAIVGAYQHSKPKKDLPVGWLRVESSRNGWGIFIDNAGGLPQFVFNNVIDCARKIVDLLQPSGCEPHQESDLIAKLAEQGLIDGGTISGLREDLIKVQAALELMTAGRDQDGVEHREAIAEFQTRLESNVVGLERLKQQRNEARAEVHALQSQIAELRQDTFPQSLDNVRLESELQCAIKQRDEMKEHADRNRAGRVTAENHIRRLQEEIRALNRQQVNQPIQMLPDIEVSITANLVKQRDVRIKDLEAELKASTGRNKECIEQREHAIKRWRDDNRLAEQRLVRIRELESEISNLGKMLQGLPPASFGIRACVDGHLYTVDELCKMHSALKEQYRSVTEAFEKDRSRLGEHVQELLCKNADLCADVANLRTENRQYSEVLKGEVADRTRLIKEVQELTTRYSKQAEFVGAQWKLGFDAGCERVMKYVSSFSKEVAESIARRGANVVNPS